MQVNALNSNLKKAFLFFMLMKTDKGKEKKYEKPAF